ncbi:hypothetical protein QR680_003478 [Steinernema hermaphroditum]|uniref:RING-type E3 ubiquitin transferase n=1 Tax=Steinernema hermaphroditum TaxID=289476 RepID=A0AA39H8W3_9BILA|nr:hypothetical protein QR680_003478 [Steinernema hermaphroditum]
MSADAPVFVPSWLQDNKIGHGELEELKPHNHKNNPSYASALGTQPSYPQDFKEELLCPYNEEGICPHPECQFIHGDLCEFCGRACLNPFSEEQRKEHKRQCVAEHEKAMEDAFAEARTVDKNCGICMENIWEKNGRFGILNNCRHCFCLDCIRRWRKSQQFEHKTTRSCPECRTHSDFVIPASRWVEDQNEKERLIELYRQNTSKKTKADKHVVEHKLNSKFEFVDDIIRIYQLVSYSDMLYEISPHNQSQSSSLQANVLKCLSALAKVSKRINVYLLSTNFVSEVVLNTDLTQLDDERALKVFLVIYNVDSNDRFFYANDLNVVSGVLERMINDTSYRPMRLLALHVAARMIEQGGRSTYPHIINSCHALLMRDDLTEDELQLASNLCR